MASKMPPADAEQLKSLLAQYHKRLMWRLAGWGAAAAFSLVAAVIVSQTGAGNKRLQIGLFGSDQPDDSMLPLSAATAPMPPADVAAVRRAADLTAAKLAAVERNTAATRSETRRLAVQVSKLTADSFRVTGRLANIEQQIDGITGSIKRHAEDAAAAAVAKAIPLKSEHDKAFESAAPVVGAPGTTMPQLSLIVPPAPDASNAERAAARDITSAIPTTPKPGSKDQARVVSKNEAKVASEATPMAKEASQKAAVEPRPKAAPEAKGQIAMKPEPKGGPMAKAEPKPRPAVAKMKMASASTPRRRVSGPYWLPAHGYGVDLGGADSVTVVNAQWAAVKANFGPMLVGMRPTAVRDHRLLDGGKFRLVVGHMRTLKLAERLCARFARQQVACQPVEFDHGRVVRR